MHIIGLSSRSDRLRQEWNNMRPRNVYAYMCICVSVCAGMTEYRLLDFMRKEEVQRQADCISHVCIVACVNANVLIWIEIVKC